ncbi:MAG TPA: hypothetical protein VEH78_06835 [Pseudolabrys sp.]|nr:hypothetical protein [Pseudolabrys sp.]
MRTLTCVFASLLIAGATGAIAQIQSRGQQPPAPPPAGPYKAVAITPPQPVNDPAFTALLKQLGETAQRKDGAALAKLVVNQGFFWVRENGDRADKRKSGADNLAAALGLNNKDGAGWDMLASFADDPTGSPIPQRKDTLCAPADPAFDSKTFNDLLKVTMTDVSDWGYPVSPDVEVHATPQANSPVVDKLGQAFVRIMPEGGSSAPSFLRIITPAGKTGFVSVDSIAPIGNDQICYVKDGTGWKIGGYIGGGDSQ